MHQQPPLRYTPVGSIRGERASGHEVVDVRMVAQVARPGLQHTQHSDLTTQEALIGGELL